HTYDAPRPAAGRLAADPNAVDAGQPEVEQHKGGARGPGQPGRAGPGPDDLVGVVAQAPRQHLADRRVVLDEQDAADDGGPSAGGGGARGGHHADDGNPAPTRSGRVSSGVAARASGP